MKQLGLLALLVLAPSIPRPTGACSPVAEDSGPHALDPAASADAVPPAAVTVSFDVYRSDPDGGGGGCGAVDTCGGGFNTVSLRVTSSDDRTPPDQLGYRVTIVGGQPPPGLALPADDRRAGGAGELNWFFDPGFHGAVSFTVELRAVDLNGNVGPATTLTITDARA